MKKPEVTINPFEHDLRVGATRWTFERLPNAIRNQIEAEAFEEDEEAPDYLGSASNAWDCKITLSQGLRGMSAFESIIRFGLHAINETNGSQLTQAGVEDLGYKMAMFLAHNDWVLDYGKQGIYEEYYAHNDPENQETPNDQPNT